MTVPSNGGLAMPRCMIEDVVYFLNLHVYSTSLPCNEMNKIIEIKVATLLLVNQTLATLGFFEVGVNLVLFLTRVLGQDNAEAANNLTHQNYDCYATGYFLDFYNLLVDAGSDSTTIAASKLGLLKEISMKPVLQVSYIHQNKVFYSWW
ncbi:hypothetical protein TSUD_320710 [Trifolium subterraneum]|uniref:Uncharacterized protein n=1 Tax=Trifolium subterraneum TaxID=3900 RepID=A0A2Z6N5F2_TRISU|nr:hypothetical protein TSUD_320710 [Trifolium subterraneum]